MSAHISAMLAVPDAAVASDWYSRALGAQELWSLGSVRALHIEGAPFLLHEPTDGFAAPDATTTVRVELFADDPDAVLARAAACDADGAGDGVREHDAPWGVHRQGRFRDPFGHTWHVGDHSPLGALPRRPL